MNIEKIYLDMDGVLADFDKGVRELCHQELIGQGKRSFEQEKELWDAVKEAGHFYAKLDPIPGAIELFETIYSKYQDRCEILTGIPSKRWGIDSAGDDKREWTARYLDERIVVNIVYRSEKVKFAQNSGCILIDDFEKNINEWTNKGCGTGILFKNPEQALEELKRIEEA